MLVCVGVDTWSRGWEMLRRRGGGAGERGGGRGRRVRRKGRNRNRTTRNPQTVYTYIFSPLNLLEITIILHYHADDEVCIIIPQNKQEKKNTIPAGSQQDEV